MGAFTVLFVVFSALLVCAAVLGIQDGVRTTQSGASRDVNSGRRLELVSSGASLL